MLRATLFAAILSMVSLAVTAQEAKPPADMARCDKLAAYYDRYALMIEKPGLMNRQIGHSLCRQGRFAEGIAELEKAIRMIGFTPPQ